MELSALYKDHLQSLQKSYEAAMAEVKAEGIEIDSVLLHSGSESYYFADDNHLPFHPIPHFAHWLPLEGSNHFLLFRPGTQLRLVRHVPRDFWYETPTDKADHWQSSFKIIEVDSLSRARAELHDLDGHVAYIGDNARLAGEWGISPELIQPKSLLTRLDFNRSYKTPYEVECLRRASARAAQGHRAARAAFEAGLSEREIHRDYLEAIGGVETDTPYGNIIALDEKAAILHYQQKRGKEVAPGQLLLIDAGARVNGYCSDITRTYLRQGADPQFAELLERMESMQRSLVESVRVGLPYPEIHRAAHRGVAQIISDLKLVRLTADEILERGLTHPFLPHGVGHFLGIQVHDVSGHMADRRGTPAPPPAEYPFLRLTRTIEAGQVFTIEPGFYFIPMLLEPFRQGEQSQYFDWQAIDRLSKLGGIRVEDDIHVTPNGPENLTRAVL
jgi:Xaa-Pro dipeptidase